MIKKRYTYEELLALIRKHDPTGDKEKDFRKWAGKETEFTLEKVFEAK